MSVASSTPVAVAVHMKDGSVVTVTPDTFKARTARDGRLCLSITALDAYTIAAPSHQRVGPLSIREALAGVR